MKDLIDESGCDLSVYGYETIKLNKFGITCSKLVIDSDERAKELKFDKGHYFIINAPLLSSLMKEHYDVLFSELRYRLEYLLKENKVKKKDKLLFVGVGNPEIMADCFGVWSVNKIYIQPYKKSNRIFKIIPNIFANTGINAYDIIRLIVEAFDISAVFLFDSLATDNISRLGCSIQFNDAGLTPGSAMNNFGLAINKDTINVPCFSVGVPMMISSKDLKTKSEIILTEKDAKEKVEFLSNLISDIFNNLLN